MKITASDGVLELHDTPGCLWLFGAFFVASGSIALLAAFYASNASELRWWERGIVVLVGMSHLAAGIHVVRTAPATRLRLTAASGGMIEISALWTKPRLEQFAVSDVHDFEIRQAKDSDGDITYQLWMWLRDGRRLPLHGVPLASRAACESAQRSLRDWLATVPERESAG